MDESEVQKLVKVKPRKVTAPGLHAIIDESIVWRDADGLVLVEDEAHPLYDPRVRLPADDALVENMLSRKADGGLLGVTDPVLVYEEEGEIKVLDGRRRVTAVRAANATIQAEESKLRVPTLLVRGTVDDLYAVMLAAFIRQDDTPLERAHKAQTLRDRGKSVGEIAAIMGCTQQTLAFYRQLLSCAPVVQEAVQAGHLSYTEAKELHALPEDQQKDVVDKIRNLKLKGKGVRAETESRKAKQEGRRAPEPQRRMMTRTQIEEWAGIVQRTGQYEMVAAVLRRVLGDDKALDDFLEMSDMANAAVRGDGYYDV